MAKAQLRLTFAVLFTALALLTFYGTTLITGPIEILYRNAAGLGSARNVVQTAALAAVVILFVAGLIVTISAALQPTSLIRKLIYTIPFFLMILALMSIVSGLLGVGVLGNFLDIQNLGPISFAAAFAAVGAGLGTIGLVVATARAKLGSRTLHIVTVATGLASVVGAVAAGAMVASVIIVATSQPSSFGDRGGRFPPNQQVTSNQQFQAPAGFRPVQNSGSAQAPQATPEASAPGAPGNNFGGDRGGRPPEGGFQPGGRDGGGAATLAPRYEVGGGLMAVFALLGLIGSGSALLALRGLPVGSTEPSLHVNYPREAGLALLSWVVLMVVVGVVIQLVPVSHANPPVQTPIHWDSAQTQALVTRACMDCHSNETRWPWYSYIAPLSWVTALHVTDGRQRYNFSELNNLEGFRKQRMGEELAQQIRSGAMPPRDYLLLHPDAQLTDAEKQQLIDGLQKSLSGS